MDNISLALMIYVLVFYHEIRDLPSKAGYYFYAVVTAVMLSLAAIYAAHYHDFISWNLQIRPDNAEYNIALYLGFAAWLFVSMFYMKRKRMIEKYVESGYILTPQLMTKLMNTLHLRSVLNAVWMVLASMVVMVRIIPELDSIAWTVFFGTVIFFVCFYVLYRFFVIEAEHKSTKIDEFPMLQSGLIQFPVLLFYFCRMNFPVFSGCPFQAFYLSFCPD